MRGGDLPLDKEFESGYSEDGIKKSRILCGHWENCIPKAVGFVINGCGYSTYMSVVSVMIRKNHIHKKVAEVLSLKWGGGCGNDWIFGNEIRK